MSGIRLHPRAAARLGATLAMNADACVHDARANTTAEGASMVSIQYLDGASL